MRTLLLAFVAGTAHGATIVPDGSVKLEDLMVDTPAGWQLQQSAQNGDTVLAGFAQGGDYVTLYAKSGTAFDLRKTFVNGSDVTVAEKTAQYGMHQWTVIETKKNTHEYGDVYVTAFTMQLRGNTYFGYARAKDKAAAERDAQTFLNAAN